MLYAPAGQWTNSIASTRGIPVVIVTAKDGARQEMERYRQMGVVDIVTKPFQLDYLLQIVRNVVGQPEQRQ